MESISICEGMRGIAVEDVQERLTHLGYEIDQAERNTSTFGATTAAAVESFRHKQGLSPGSNVDKSTWILLVDESYELGDRTLYLRLPNYHGADVRKLQTCLNIMGFSCGKTDGIYGVHTESAVKQFQESQGELADGMCFQDTYDAIERLHHVWGGKSAAGPYPMGGMGFARAAGVLEANCIVITGKDPISRNVAGRIWNLASATTHKNSMILVDSPSAEVPENAVLFVLDASAQSSKQQMRTLAMDDIANLPMRIRTALSFMHGQRRVLRIELPYGLSYDGTFTTDDSQTFAVKLLDAICMAYDEEGFMPSVS